MGENDHKRTGEHVFIIILIVALCCTCHSGNHSENGSQSGSDRPYQKTLQQLTDSYISLHGEILALEMLCAISPKNSDVAGKLASAKRHMAKLVRESPERLKPLESEHRLFRSELSREGSLERRKMFERAMDVCSNVRSKRIADLTTYDVNLLKRCDDK